MRLFAERLGCSSTLWSLSESLIHAAKVSADDAAFLFSLTASYSFLLYVHQVTVHAGSPRERRHNPIRVPVFKLLVSEGLSVQDLAVLQGHFAVPIGAHLVRQLSHGKESLKHLVHVGVFLR